MTAEKTSIRQQVGEEVIGKKPQRSQKYRHYKTANLMGMRTNAWFIRESNKMQSDNSMTTQKKEEIRLRKLEQERIQANLFKAVVDLKQEVNNPGEQNPETHLFVTPPNILKQQLTGYCTSSASSPMGHDNKHGWYEEHEKFVAIATRSLSSVLLVGDSLVNGLARYHRVWSKYLEPLRALNFGVGGDRT